MHVLSGNVVEDRALRGCVECFRDRAHAGETLAELMESSRGSGATVYAIPAGGVPVAAALARKLALPLDLVVVSKITLPWNTESGYGAVAFDGTVRLNDALRNKLGLTDADVGAGVRRTRDKVERRVRELRRDMPPLAAGDGPAIVVDDGLASGITMLTAIAALRNAGAQQVEVAVPTGHLASVNRIAPQVDRIYCANVRGGPRFAVASAYLRWHDVSEDEVRSELDRFAKAI